MTTFESDPIGSVLVGGVLGLDSLLSVFYRAYRYRNGVLIVRQPWSLRWMEVDPKAVTALQRNAPGEYIWFYTNGQHKKRAFSVSSYADLNPLQRLINFNELLELNAEASE